MKIISGAIGSGLTFILAAGLYTGILEETDSLLSFGKVTCDEQALTLLENEFTRSPGSYDCY